MNKYLVTGSIKVSAYVNAETSNESEEKFADRMIGLISTLNKTDKNVYFKKPDYVLSTELPESEGTESKLDEIPF